MFHELRVAEVRRETDDAVSLAFDVPPALAGAFRFRPGQYLTIRAEIEGAEVRRAYSICSGPDEPGLRVAVKRVAGGAFSGWAHEAVQAGHMVSVMPPEGRFTLPEKEGPEKEGPAGSGRTVLGVAAGSGITPVMSIMKSVLAREPASRFALLYGSRSTGSILFRDEIEALKDRHLARLAVLHVLSREQQDIPVLNGRIDGEKLDAVLPGLCAGARPDVALVCGPGPMIDAATRHLAGLGMDRARILSERFTTGVEPRAAPRAEPAGEEAGAPPFAMASVVSDGASALVPMRAGETVLDAALRAGLDLPWSCRGGMCSTCRARVTEGSVEMEVNYGLEPWETAAGYVLTCQARPTTARVSVDYDHV